MRTAQNSQKIMTTKITVTALLTAVAIALQYIEVPIPLVPSFLKLDFSDLPELIGAFVLGPQYGIIICLLKNLIHLPVSSSMFVGEFSNFILGAIFVFVAGIIYQYNKTKKRRFNWLRSRCICNGCIKRSYKLLYSLSCLCRVMGRR